MSATSVLSILGWIFLIPIYLGLVVQSKGSMIIVLAPLFYLSYRAYQEDLLRERRETDHFKGTSLFFRYGRCVKVTNFSIPIDAKWSDNDVRNFAAEMSHEIESRVRQRLRDPDITTIGLVNISDKEFRADNKGFLKILFKTMRGSQLSHFVHYAVAGKSIVAHYFTYLRGTYEWYDVVNFVFCSPVTIWFWGLKWLDNKYSIISALSKTVDNSFDTIDINTFYESSRYVLLDETRSFLKEKDLLSEELAQIIFNQINNNNSQNITVNNSTGISLGNVSNLSQAVAQSA